ncbi:hypothetical protein [Mycobacterium sp. 236(2023)]|uniref:DUF7159 family protein n=1 Tax=Mycobacterium sp. 236(2023) TaxID=3038163 RepID=UPI0024155AE7|nr:hypothetical protein [Mycobacterium sp. 236(2023)]MDG4666809.1 hypothetical protein [Mycobacterium sp. 236(2023)]
MDAVLGLSVTPSAVGVVLVEGQDPATSRNDGLTLDGETFEVRRRGRSNAVETSAQAAAAVLRSEAVAADLGRRVHSIGVTWSDDAHTEASLLLKSLSDSGFDNIVPVRLSEATDALARRIAQVLGYQTTAVCVIEPEQLIALVVSSGDDADGSTDAVQTAVNHTVVTEDDLVGWLSTVFARADWEPEALVLVGSAEDLDGLLPVLEDALAVPVFSPDEAQLALARGAALACAQPAEFGSWDIGETRPAKQPVAKRFARTGPAALLAAGAVAFVVSVSAAVALQLAPEPAAPQPSPAAETAPRSPAAAPRPVAPAPAAPVIDPAFTAPEAPAPVIDEVPAEAPPVAEEAPIVEAALPDAGLPAALPPDAALPPAAAPPVVPPAVAPPPVPEQRPGILQRIRDRLSGIGNDDAANMAPPPPVVAPPPPPPLP